MKRSDLLRVVTARTGLPVEEVVCVVDALLDEITDALAAGEEVAIRRFGTFKPVSIRGNTRPDPNSGRTLAFPAMKTARWRPSKLVRDRLMASDSASESVSDA